MHVTMTVILLQVIEILLDAGANLEHLDDISGTPLHGAARRNHCTCCRVLLNRGARVDASDDVGNRPLHLAAAEGAMSALEVCVCGCYIKRNCTN